MHRAKFNFIIIHSRSKGKLIKSTFFVFFSKIRCFLTQINSCNLCSRSYIRSLFDRNESNSLSSNCAWPNVNATSSKSNDIKSSESHDANNNNPDQNDLQNGKISKKTTNDTTVTDDGLTITNCASPHDPTGDNRILIKGRFLAINAATMSCRCGHSKYGISPSQHLGNGCCDLIVVGQCRRKDYLKYLLRTGFSEKSAVSLASPFFSFTFLVESL